jgi:CheY-like chemotaxis protein
MSYIPTIVIDDDNHEILKIFRFKSEMNGVHVKTFDSWLSTLEYLESGNPVDAVVLDARGKIRADKTESDSHILEALKWMSKKKLPYAIYTAFAEEMDFLQEEISGGTLFSKGRHKVEDVFDYLKKQIANSPKVKYPEPFGCFGTHYLGTEYQELLINVVHVFENKELTNPENMLFNPCRIILEQVFKKMNDEAPELLPGLLIKFEDQRVGLTNCSKYLNGQKVIIWINENGKSVKKEMQQAKFFPEYISQQIQTIIAVCHPASHEIQKYTRYTFQSVLWAIFDVLIWMKLFIDNHRK